MDKDKKYKLKNHEVCGLDIGSSSVKLVVLQKKDGGYSVSAAGISRLNTQAGSYEASVSRAIADCLSFARLRTKRKFRAKMAVCGVSGPEVAVRDFEFPTLPDGEVSGAVFFEASLVCPFNLEQAAVDYQVIAADAEQDKMQNDEEKIKGILVAATNNLLASRLEAVKNAGLKCILMDVDGLALLNSFANLNRQQEKVTTAILNVGASCTTLAIMNKNGWPFIRDINGAGNYIIDQIARNSEVSTPEIIDILFSTSPDIQTEEASALIDNYLEKGCKDLIADISETLRFYAAGEKSTPIEKIYVCGGFAPARGFIELLSRRLRAEVCLWNPFDNLDCNLSERGKDIIAKTGPAMAVATGLAMRSMELAGGK